MPARLQLIARTGHPDFLDLPWDEPLAEWESERLVEVVRGIHRHVVRFVEYETPFGPALYALKELPTPIARREYGLLRDLAAEEMPVVEAVGVVSDRGKDLEAVLITRHLDYSLPFRTLFARGSVPDLRRRLLDAGAELLVRLHLGGFFWGDCSLSNTLFRRDAGALAAYLVDAETGEMHPNLSDGQRRHDLMIAEENVAGELADVEAELGRRGRAGPGGDRRRPRRPLRVVVGRADAGGVVRRRQPLQDRRAAAPAERARLRRRRARADRGRRRLPAAAEPSRRRARPPPAPPARAHRADGAGESGPASPQRPRALPRRARPQGRPAGAGDRRRAPLALGGLRACRCRDTGRALGQAGRRRGLPRGARAPLVPVAAGATRTSG